MLDLQVRSMATPPHNLQDLKNMLNMLMQVCERAFDVCVLLRRLIYPPPVNQGHHKHHHQTLLQKKKKEHLKRHIQILTPKRKQLQIINKQNVTVFLIFKTSKGSLNS